MDNPSGSSFIPKSPVSGAPQPHKVRRVYLFTYITLVIFIGSLLAAGAAYGYSIVANHKLLAEQDALNKQKNRFDQTEIDAVRWRSAELAAVEGLLNHHPFVYSIFNALEQSTARNIVLSNFTLQSAKDETGGLVFSVTVTAPNANDLIFQRTTFEQSAMFADATYTAMTVGESASTTSLVPGATVSTASFIMSKVFMPSDLPLDTSLYSSPSAGSTTLPDAAMTPTTTTTEMVTPATTTGSSQ